ncbi:uncharacterized protein LOC131646857 [Vicia villosa]|uniref:uncharacterized protein LOC131646857 n=1 Tax=Vicia villosa TaxID=3911 RepID=UPI00273CB2B0|nr:uncharacterized protein LOC131646857 [Vicia villosa]
MDFKNISSSPPSSLEFNMNTDHNTNTHSHNLSLKDSSSSFATHNYGSHAPGILKAMKILKAQFSNSNALTSSPSAYNNEDVINSYNNTMQMNVFYDAYHPNLLVTGSSQSHELRYDQTAVVSVDRVASARVYFKKKNTDDGRTHSLPHKKYGPYTCPKCYQVLATSQKFASHVTSNHYKFESPKERKKRCMSRTNKKSNIQIHKQTTYVPAAPSTYQPYVASLVNNEDQIQTQSLLALPLNGV